MLRPSRLLAPFLLLLVVPLTRAQDAASDYAITPMATSWVELHGHRYAIEIAQTNAQRARGLMFRDHLADNRGMLFIHDAEEPLAYWMKNTLIALDIFYFDSKRRLVSVSKRTPPCTLGDNCPPYLSDGPALYVLELNAGVADRLHVQKGDRLTFAPDIPAAASSQQP